MELLTKFGKRGTVQEYGYRKVKHKFNLVRFLYREMKSILISQLRQITFPLKFSLEINVIFEKIEEKLPGYPIRRVQIEPWFRSRVHLYFGRLDEDLTEELDEVFIEILSAYDNWMRAGSGWTLKKILKANLSIARFVPLSGAGEVDSCGYKQLPLIVKRKKALYKLINTPTMEPNRCFVHAMRAAHTIHRGRGLNIDTTEFDMRQAVDESVFDLCNITYPSDILDVKTFERKNNISINVYAINSRGINRTKLNNMSSNSKKNHTPPLNVIYHSKMTHGANYNVDLLLFNGHYFLIRNMSSFFAYRKNGKTFVCRSCLSLSNGYYKYTIHRRFCDHKGQVYRFPTKQEAKIKFSKFEAKTPKSFAIYFDCETRLCSVVNSAKNTKKNARKILYEHEALVIGAKRICRSNPKFNSELFISSQGSDCLEEFFDWLDIQAVEISIIFQEVNYALRMTDQDWDHFWTQKHCAICSVQMDEKTQRHRDHDHLFQASGPLESNYRGAKCRTCNLVRSKNSVWNTPVFAHFGSGFDTKLLIREMAERVRAQSKCRFRVINKSRENNMAIFYKEFVFLDSYNWLSAPLSELIECRIKAEKTGSAAAFPLIMEYVGHDEEKYTLLAKRKQVFPYQLITEDRILSEVIELPDMDLFYNNLRDEPISRKDYDHASLVWRTFNCRHLADFLDIYLASDVLALAQIYEAYRDLGLKEFGLDSVYFFSSSHQSWHQLLHFSKVELQLIQNADIYNMFYESVRGG